MKTILRYPGSKWNLAKRIVDFFPEHKSYLEPYFGTSKGLSASDVALKLRSQGIFQLKEVKRAVIEQNGQLIIVRMGDENPKYPIITDGVVQVEILETIGETEEWLMSELNKKGFENVDDIFIAEYDKGELNVVTY